MIKKVIISLSVIVFSFSLLLVNSNECSVLASEIAGDEGATTYSDIYRWVYKEENGKRYMRLWDASNLRWVTNWILVD